MARNDSACESLFVKNVTLGICELKCCLLKS